jgi:hypothetical protein
MQYVFPGTNPPNSRSAVKSLQAVSISTEDVPPSQSVVERVAAREGVDHTELTPLFDAIDPDALDKILDTSPHTGSALQVSFTYHGYDVTVTGDGEVRLGKQAEFKR